MQMLAIIKPFNHWHCAFDSSTALLWSTLSTFVYQWISLLTVHQSLKTCWFSDQWPSPQPHSRRVSYLEQDVIMQGKHEEECVWYQIHSLLSKTQLTRKLLPDRSLYSFRASLIASFSFRTGAPNWMIGSGSGFLHGSSERDLRDLPHSADQDVGYHLRSTNKFCFIAGKEEHLLLKPVKAKIKTPSKYSFTPRYRLTRSSRWSG